MSQPGFSANKAAGRLNDSAKIERLAVFKMQETIRLVGLRVSVSHDLAAVPDACAYAENTCP